MTPKVLAHPGRTDSGGGHYCRTNCPDWGYDYGEYHYHGGYRPNYESTPTPKPTATPTPTPTSTVTPTPTNRAEKAQELLNEVLESPQPTPSSQPVPSSPADAAVGWLIIGFIGYMAVKALMK